MSSRFDRQIQFFGTQAQERIQSVSVAVVGVGGLGSHVVQQLSYLGVGSLTLIDDDKVDDTNLNRLVGACDRDLGRLKVEVLQEYLQTISPSLAVTKIQNNLRTPEAIDTLRRSDFVFGCVDHDGPRFLLNRVCSAYDKPYLDLATEIGQDRSSYGGRIVRVRPGKGCLMCWDLLDQAELQEWVDRPEDETFRDHAYGQVDAATGGGPAVISLNGIIASAAVTEFLLELSNIRDAYGHLEYRGPFGCVINLDADRSGPPGVKDCITCVQIAGRGADANIEDEFLR